MYFDNKPCAVCGSEVRLERRSDPPVGRTDGPVGEGVVGDGDSNIDERVCANPDCPTNAADETAGTPRP
ncbi:MAG: hypothetical protein JWR90_235 [Marmoricola sp.]|jgi:hypothetical protein|nr:hypothetical protein [Marmoricola sp.]